MSLSATNARTCVKFILLAAGAFLMCAALAVFLPVAAMASAHQWLGLGEFPDAPITVYLALDVDPVRHPRPVDVLHGVDAPTSLAVGLVFWISAHCDGADDAVHGYPCPHACVLDGPGRCPGGGPGRFDTVALPMRLFERIVSERRQWSRGCVFSVFCAKNCIPSNFITCKNARVD